MCIHCEASKIDIHNFRAEAIVEQTSAGLPVYSIPQISNQLTNGYWQFNGFTSHSWAPANNVITYDVTGLSNARAQLAKLAFETWEDVTGLTFRAVSQNAEITLDDTDAGKAYASSSTIGHKIVSANINVGPSWYGGISSLDSYTFQTFIHEIGHTLGLGHAGNYNGSATYGVDNHYRNDTWQYSIMSYMSQNNFGGASYRFVMTPQMADIYAVIKKYGAGEARESNTTYGFHVEGLGSETGRIYNFNNYGQAPALTIYDTGGRDTLDFSLYSQDQNIYLKGGTWSDVGGLNKNIGIYITTVIENAYGGSGRDILSGNAANNHLRGNAGNDRLLGLSGNDTYTGGAGADIFFFRPNWDHDVVSRFDSADRINLSQYNFSSANRALSFAHNEGKDVVFNFGHGDTLRIEDTHKNELNNSDFIL